MYYIHDKKTGDLSRMMAKPYMEKGSQFEELTEEEFNAKLAEKRGEAKANAELFAERDDLTEGVSEDNGEDG